jgi:hypothetical protein
LIHSIGKIIKQKLINETISFKELNSDLRNDRNLALIAVKQDGMNLEFVSSKLKADKEICMMAIKENRNSYTFLSSELKKDKDVLNYMKNNMEFTSFIF